MSKKGTIIDVFEPKNKQEICRDDKGRFIEGFKSLRGKINLAEPYNLLIRLLCKTLHGT